MLANRSGNGLALLLSENPASAIEIAFGPDKRTMLRAAGPGAVAIAAMVSPGSNVAGDLASAVAPTGSMTGTLRSREEPSVPLATSRLGSRAVSLSFSISIFITIAVVIAIVGNLAVCGIFARLFEYA
jgi:hypothetical protein